MILRHYLPQAGHLLCALLLTALTLTGCGSDPNAALKRGFNNPPKEAKVRTWWHWLDGNVTREGITADLEAMHRVGIQEATLFNGGMGFPAGDVKYMSPEWLELVHHAASEAKRLGMELSFHNCAGWSSSGGPWVKPEDGMQTVTISEQQATGGKLISLVLAQPETRLDCYSDIAVLAFPTPQSDVRINDLNAKSLSQHAYRNHLMPSMAQVDEKAVVRQSDILDLTAQMKADGTLEWDAPQGHWTILRIGFTPTGRENAPAPKEGRGLEVDKMSRRALDNYWAGGLQPIIDKLGPLVGTAFNGALVDSYEVGCGNWTEGFDQEFQSRRHYDIRPFLPTLAGYYVESGEVSERFLWDFRFTIGELTALNYYEYFAELCHQNGMRFLTEPYDGPFNSMEIGAPADVPMSEFWVVSNSFGEKARMAASIAHHNGNQIVGAESFTATGDQSKHRNHPGFIKALGDLNWTEGVNRFILHTNAHQPWEIGPGFSLGQFGTNFNRHNTWWEQGRAWMDYCARSQFMLQQGEGVQDVLFFIGESTPNNGIDRPEIREAGLDYDIIGLTKLLALTVEDNLICSSSGRHYRMLLLPENEPLSLTTLRKLKELAEGGAAIFGPKPEFSPSLDGYPESDVEYQALADELWGKTDDDAAKALIKRSRFAEALQATGLKPDFTDSGQPNRLRYIHRRTPSAEIYFISNQQKSYRRELCTFRVEGMVPELWNPQKGTIEPIAVWNETEGGTQVTLDFSPEQAYFVVFRERNSTDRQFTSFIEEMPDYDKRPVVGLSITKAEYGQLPMKGVKDITDILIDKIHDGRLNVVADNSLAQNDPAYGTVKELRVEYTTGNQPHSITVRESHRVILPQPGESGELSIQGAFYGRIGQGFIPVRVPAPVDVTDQIKARIQKGEYTFRAGEITADLPNRQEILGEPKLHLIYTIGGVPFDNLYGPDMTVDFKSHNREKPTIMTEGTKFYWVTSDPGHITLTDKKGQTHEATVTEVPEAMTIEGNWDVHFNQKWGREWDTTLPELISWSTSDNEDVKYFSGTAIYTKTFNLPNTLTKKDLMLKLDLGQVYVMAEVILNGKNLGILWNAPYDVDITKVARTGENQLEVRVTNQWVNRLIGDDRLPEDFKQNGASYEEWPEWMQHPEQPRESGRTTFVAYKHWNSRGTLLPAGLVGPVTVKAYAKVKIN
ncbi:MAG: hypothetical protein IJR87_00595 [Bacteroidaceae bacterium]|nr:hypothetical protein [Bacteroidaceae bacterium]